MVNPLTAAMCTIDITVEPQTTKSAVIVSWLPFRIHITVAHARLQVLAMRIARAKKCGDGAAARQWTDNRERLIRLLAGQAAYSVTSQLHRRRRMVDTILTLLFIATTALWLRASPGVALVTDLVLVALLWAVAYGFQNREKYIQELVRMSFALKEQRSARGNYAN